MNRLCCLKFVWFGLLLCWAALAGATDIQVAVDRNPVGLGESFQITLTATEEPDGSPDFGPLQENFEIVNQQRSSNSSWVNGKSSRSEQWILTAMARQAGEILIPPIAFGADSSKPLKLSVKETTDEPKSNDELFLEVGASPEQPYVQSQVIYTLKLFRRVQITQASLSEPDIKDALVEKLGEDSTYATQIKGVDYWVTERKYAIFPQQSGVFTIAPLILNAEFISDRQPRSRFNGFFNRPNTENRRVASKALTLHVQPVPSSFKSTNWLSAESLELKENWSDASVQAKVGEPLTRTLTLIAKGTTVGQLPELLSKTPIDGIKTYPDQPVLREDKVSDGLSAFREEKVAIIASKPGEYWLPALEISWFNTRTQKAEVARLPSVKVKAVAAPNADSPAQPTVKTESRADASPLAASPITVTSDADTRFWKLLSVALAAGWLLTILWFTRRSDRPRPTLKSAALAETPFEKSLKRACWENNPQAAKQALLQWGKAEFGADSLGALAACLQGALAAEILILNRSLYAGGDETPSWSGQKLWDAFHFKSKTAASVVPENEPLEPLYKI